MRIYSLVSVESQFYKMKTVMNGGDGCTPL